MKNITTFTVFQIVVRHNTISHNTSEKPVRYPKDISDRCFEFQKELFGYQTCRAVCLYVGKYEMFRISQANFSDITFRVPFRISEKLIGFVMTLRLTDFQESLFIILKSCFLKPHSL